MFIYGQYFRAPSPLKPLKSRPQGQNLLGFPLIAHSDHRGPVSAQFCPLSCLFVIFVDLYFLYEAILGPLKASFDQLDQKKMNN